MGFKIDNLVASIYAPKLLQPIKFGENGVSFWIPGSGMTTIVQNIFSSKALLNKYLPYNKIIEVLSFWGHESQNKNFQSLINTLGFSDYKELEKKVLNSVDEGREVVCVLGKIDDYSVKERISILKSFAKLSSKNRHRIHILFNSFDKPWFESKLLKHPELIILANYLEIMPILSGNILKTYIKEQSKLFATKISDKDCKDIAETYGGMIQLVRSCLRSQNNKGLAELKFSVNWNRFPKIYKTAICNKILDPNIKLLAGEKDLKEFGVLNLGVFYRYKHLLRIDPLQILEKLLTTEERNLWKHLSSNSLKLIGKEEIIDILRPNNIEDVSLWAVDQAISRFRKKLIRAGIDPDSLKTQKGKGYIWQG